MGLGFTDGTTREIDLGPLLGGPVFEHLRDDGAVFVSVTVDQELGTIVRPNGAGIDPDVLHGGPAGGAAGSRDLTR